MIKWVASKYPGELLFSISWAWMTRGDGQKPFVQRMMDAVEDAEEGLPW